MAEFETFVERLLPMQYAAMVRAVEIELGAVNQQMRIKGLKREIRADLEGLRKGLVLLLEWLRTARPFPGDPNLHHYRRIAAALIEHGEMKPEALNTLL